jgi:hypothetical protein
MQSCKYNHHFPNTSQVGPYLFARVSGDAENAPASEVAEAGIF